MTWEAALRRRWAAPVRVLDRRPLAGGYTSAGVERIDLDVDGRERTVVLKQVERVEAAAMRALAAVPEVPRLHALAAGPGWLVLPFVDGHALGASDPFPDEVWEVLARVHAHWWGRRPRGLPVVDMAWWWRQCDQTLVALRGGLERTGELAYRAAESTLRSWRDDRRIATALSVLPRTLTHGDPHRGNVLVDAEGPVLLDWGAARFAPAEVDIAVPVAQLPGPTDAYDRLFAQLTGGRADRVPAVAELWAQVHVHVQYMGFAADHLGGDRVGEMVDVASRALGRLGGALRRSFGSR